jgi:hypothetical protein
MSKHDRFYSNPSQRYWVCASLLAGRTLTTKTEIREVQGWRLAAVIHVLIHEYGWPIDSEYRGRDNIKHYWLRRGADRSKLRFPSSARSLADEGGAA